MDKAILIIDMPSVCIDCPCLKCDFEDDWCAITGEVIYNRSKKHADCPLKPVPEKKLIWSDDESCDWERGFNDCIDEILGN